MAKYYYNETLLPELPSDIANYPYLFILYENAESKYTLYGSSHPFYVDNNLTTSSIELRTFDSNSDLKEVVYFECTGESTEWVVVDTLSSYGYLHTLSDSNGEQETLIWTNTDIPYDSEDSTEIYMYASEPILDSEDECYKITKTKLSRFGYEIRRISGKTEKMETNEMLKFLGRIENAEGVGF